MQVKVKGFLDLRLVLCNTIVEKHKPCMEQVETKQCDFRKALCMMIVHDCSRMCCDNISSFSDGVTTTKYFDRGEKTSLDKVPDMARDLLSDCLKIEHSKVVSWFI